jgi:hypothetical protein
MKAGFFEDTNYVDILISDSDVWHSQDISKRKNALVELWYTSSQRLFPYPNPIFKQKELQTRKRDISPGI